MHLNDFKFGIQKISTQHKLGFELRRLGNCGTQR